MFQTPCATKFHKAFCVHLWLTSLLLMNFIRPFSNMYVKPDYTLSMSPLEIQSYWFVEYHLQQMTSIANLKEVTIRGRTHKKAFPDLEQQ